MPEPDGLFFEGRDERPQTKEGEDAPESTSVGVVLCANATFRRNLVETFGLADCEVNLSHVALLTSWVRRGEGG